MWGYFDNRFKITTDGNSTDGQKGRYAIDEILRAVKDLDLYYKQEFSTLSGELKEVRHEMSGFQKLIQEVASEPGRGGKDRLKAIYSSQVFDQGIRYGCNCSMTIVNT